MLAAMDRMPDVSALRDRLGSLRGRGLSAVDAVAEATTLAADLQRLANAGTTRREAKELAVLARLMEDPAGRVFTTAMTDQALRARDSRRVAGQLAHLVETIGAPRYLPSFDRFQLRAFRRLAHLAPKLLVPAVLKRIKGEMGRYVIDGEPDRVGAELKAMLRRGTHPNLNQLGEAILGEDEAEARLARYLDAVRREDVAAVSIKISSIASQLDLLAFEDSVATLADRLRRLFHVAHGSRFVDLDETVHPTLVTLDMEEYRDLHLTLEAFERVLDEEDLLEYGAGIVLQAYLPDSHAAQRRLVAWSRRRVARGGAPIRLRLVKGANLAMERVDAAVHGWKQAPYTSKADVDASFKRMVLYGVAEGRLDVVRLGVASHNVFDLAYGLVVRELVGAPEHLSFEMLEGISASLRRVVRDVAGDVLVYAPAVVEDELQSAIAYLIRRLDENTSPENFLRHVFELEPGSAAWEEQERRFVASCGSAALVFDGVRRDQDRREPPSDLDPEGPFVNEPDTDWTLAHNRAWVDEILARWRTRSPVVVGPVVAGEEILDGAGGIEDGFDPSRPGHVPYRWVKADQALLDRALATARDGAASWSARKPEVRSAVLASVAHGLRVARGELIGAMTLDGGKAISESDAEISEAIDFAEYYRRSLAPFAALPGVHLAPLGVVVVAPPWNFPLAIPAGGVLAALMAGNAVILKPAPETVLVAWELCRVMWEAGVPRDALQFLPCDNDPVGSALVKDRRVDAVVLTGGTATARKLLGLRPELRLFAETGGKNAAVVTDLSDADLAIKHVVHGAFGHAGQKCSATSLLILEAAVYDDEGFMRRLADAVRSVHVGPAWERRSKVTPLIRPPREELTRGLTQLDEGERWLVEPAVDPDNPRLWSPGVKLDVKPGAFTHRTELFGPVLSVMRAESLEHAVELVNQTEYGLTSGLQSLDAREHAYWRDHVEAGNLYINRPTTGAVVQRQPFGGRKGSVFGPAAKAGGPNYVLQLCRVTEDPSAVVDDERAVREYFGVEHDPTRLLGQDNHLRYQPLKRLVVRVGPGAREEDFDRVIAGVKAVGADFVVSVDSAPTWLISCERVRHEAAAALGARLGLDGVERVRVVGQLEPELREAASGFGVHCEASPPLQTSRIELLRYLNEQAISMDYHRFGNLGAREDEDRRGPVT